MNICVLKCVQCPQSPEDCAKFPGTGFTGDCESSDMSTGINLCPLKD